MEVYYPMLWNALGMFLFLAFELSALFILISFGVSLLQQFIPDTKIQAVLSGKGGRGYVFAAALGAITPFCSCSTIPMLRGLLKAKAGFGPTMTFLFCSPLLNPIIIGLFIATFGAKVTGYYTAIALVISVLSGFILEKIGFERHVIPESDSPAPNCDCGTASLENIPKQEANGDCCSNTATPCCVPAPLVTCCTPMDVKIDTTKGSASASCCGASTPSESNCCGDPTPASLTPTWRLRSQFAFWSAINQFKAVLVYLVLGVALGAFVYGFVPSDFIAKYASGDSILAIPVAAVIGIPLYVRAETLIPLSAVLAEKGMGLGAIMALIIGGSGASITEVILLKSMFRFPMVIAFLVVILGMAVSAGYLFQYVL